VAADKVRIDNPTQNLESYFLDVVEKAKRAAAETSGAMSGARVAAYLRGTGDEEHSAEKILDRLTLPQAAPVAPPTVAEQKPAVDDKKLEGLTKAAEPAPATNQPTPAPEEKELAKADEKLSSLLGGKK
jgi:hypothetical protein